MFQFLITLLIKLQFIDLQKYNLIQVLDKKIQVKFINMSQHNSSMLSSGVQNVMQNSMQSNLQNSQAKYQKALKQISKLIATNKNLKTQFQQSQRRLQDHINEMNLQLGQAIKKYQQVQIQKQKMQSYIQELQDTNQDLRKQYQTMQRQVGYLNDVLSQQNAQLKKLSVFRDQKGISQLLRSYQQKQTLYKKDISRLQDNISSLKVTIDRLQSDLAQQTQMRQRYEDQYNIVGLQINKYRDLNNYLMNQNQIILNEQTNKQLGYGKHQELESVVFEFKRQLENIRNIKYEAEDVSEKQYVKNYQMLLEEKNHIAIELAKARDQVQITQARLKEMYDMEQKMSTAVARSQIIIQQNNMLKNRITLLQSKQIIDGAGFDQDSELKDFQDKINFMISKADPLMAIKNGDDNTHFLAMKSIIVDLQTKLQSVIQKKQTFQRKYKNIKIKFTKKAQQSIILQQSNKLLKGKLQGYQRLTQKLHYELQRSMHAHEDQIVKMVAITNNLVGRKVQQSKTTSAFIKSQFQIELQKAEKAQKTLSQQIQSLKLQTSTQRIKISDLEQRLRQSQQFIQIYQTKITQISSRYKQLQQQNTVLNQNVLKFQQLYRQQKTRHQTILIQKQNLANKISLITEELNERTYKWEEQMKMKEENYQGEIKRNKIQIKRFKDEVETLKVENRKLLTQVDQRKIKENSTLTNLKNQTHYYHQLQQDYNQLRRQNNSLQNQLITLKHKLSNFDHLSQQLSQLQTQLMRKNDQLNDQKRSIIILKKQLQGFQLSNNDLRQHNQQLKKQISALTSKLYQEPSNSTSRDSFSSNREAQNRKTIQRLNQQIAVLQSALRDQKIKTSRTLSQIQTHKDEIQRLEQIINKGKLRQQSLLNTISQTHDQVSRIQDELFEYKSKYSHNSNTLHNLNQSLDQSGQKITSLNQQIASLRTRFTKSQSKYDNLVRDLSGIKYYLPEIQKMVKRLNTAQRLQWEQQREKQSISNLVDALSRIIKNNQNVSLSHSGSNQQYSFVPSSSFGNLQNNYYTQASSENYTKINFGGSFGNEQTAKNNAITNDTFKQYQGSSNLQSFANVNYSDDFDQVQHAGNSLNQAGSSFSSFSRYQQV